LQTMAATDFVSRLEEEQEDWEVDFPYVVRGFLSYKVPYVLGFVKTPELETACRVVGNFLNYVCITFPKVAAPVLTRKDCLP
jgi:Argonaute siRNA chaperone (ARC) complex subunit Arb1